jgi:hypothetical protein
LPDPKSRVRDCVKFRKVREAVVVELAGDIQEKSGLVRTLRVNLTWDSGDISFETFTYLAGGAHRDAYCSAAGNYVLKVHRIVPDAKNNNKSEWNAYQHHTRLHALLPAVFGYFEQELKGVPVAFLVVARVAFTFGEMLQRQRHTCPVIIRLTIVIECVIAVVRQLINGSKLGLHLRDWHLDNVGFSDEVNPKMILLDWEGNIPAGANLSPRHCIDEAVRCFSKSLCGPLFKCRDDITGRSREVQANIGKWRKCLTALSERLLFWWTQIGKLGVDIPSEYMVSCLKDALVLASQSILVQVNQDVRGGVQTSRAEALEFIATDVSGPCCNVRIGADAERGWLAKIVEV